jgi:hypothetical protein
MENTNTDSSLNEEQEVKTELNLDSKEVQVAAGKYAHMSKQIRQLSRNMTRNGLARAVSAFADFPFAEKYPKFRNEQEQQMFLLLIANQDAKAIVGKALTAEMPDLENTAVENVAKELTGQNQETKETVNGRSMD